jgi:hypothetical protein
MRAISSPGKKKAIRTWYYFYTYKSVVPAASAGFQEGFGA